MIYYNENDPCAVAILKQLIADDILPPGDVDDRSIEDVEFYDLLGYTQHHFFAGFGGWPLALLLAGVDPSAPVCTGSCPCQPFSAAGKSAGFADERHLWPAWHWLIQQLRPAVILGEQVASRAADDWIDLVHADMEAVGYAFGCVPFPAASVRAPHIRDRTYWVAHRSGARLERRHQRALGHERQAVERSGGAGRLAYSPEQRRDQGRPSLSAQERDGALRNSTDHGSGSFHDFWRDADWLRCRDGKWRPVEPGTFPLAHGVLGRVGSLRAYGNSIVPQQAATFIEAVSDWLEVRRLT